MSQIKSFNDSSVRALRKEVEEAIQAIASKYGLKASTLGNIGYTPSTMHTGKLTFAVADSQKPVEGVLLGDLIGRRYKQGSRTFTIIGTEAGKLLARTNRGARYLIRKEQLDTMIQL
jgi:hypothetical protein